MTNYQMDELSIEITYACDMRCKHCSSSAGARLPNELTTERILQIIDEAVEKCGTTALSISGGEPLCHPDLFKIMDHAWSKGLQILLYTSGVISTGSRKSIVNGTEVVTIDYTGITPVMAKVFQKYADVDKSNSRWGITTKDKFKVIFGVNGSDEAHHDEITQIPGSFKMQQFAIKNCIDAGLYVACHFVPTALNYKEIPKVVDYFNSIGAHEISLLRYVPQGRGLLYNDQLLMTKEQFEDLQHIIISEKHRAESLNIRFRPGIPVDFAFLCGGWDKPKPCDGGKTKILVRPTGEVNVCPAWKNLPEYVAGNLTTQSVSDVWEHAPTYMMFRDFKPEMLKGKCSLCEFRDKCWGGCAAQRLLTYGDICQGPDPLCFRVPNVIDKKIKEMSAKVRSDGKKVSLSTARKKVMKDKEMGFYDKQVEATQ
jgi:radical SAM protein with 4Fe4S-binding SPASM domain